MWNKVWGVIKRFFSGLDKFLAFVAICCSTIGVTCIYSMFATGLIYSFRAVIIQAGASILGIVAASVISEIDYKLIAKLWRFYTPICVLLVVLTYFVGDSGLEGSDDKAWLNLGITTVQPAEFLKLAFVFTFSIHLIKTGSHINELKHFLLLCAHGGVATLLVMLQGDFGTALVFFGVFIFMIIAAGLSLRLIAVGIVAALAAVPLIWQFVIPDYLKLRFEVAWHPELYLDTIGVQQYRGRIAMGSGGLFGRGLFSDDLYYVPIEESDFILSYVGQVFGFVGIVITLLLIVALCVKILINAKMSKDLLGNYVCVGIFAMFLIQTLINVGMVMCFLPVIGITLPLISSGGSSIVVMYAAIGIAMSVYRQNKKEMMFD